MSRKTKKKKRSKAIDQMSKPAPPPDSINDLTDNLIFSGTLLVLFFRPFISGRTYPTYNHFFNIVTAVIAVLWVVKSWRNGKLELHNRLLTGFLFAFFLVCSFTFFTTTNKGITLRYIYELASYSLLFLILANNFRSRSSVMAAVITLIVAGLLVNVYGLAQSIITLEMTRQYVEQALQSGNRGALAGVPLGSAVVNRLEASRIFSFFLHPNSYALYLDMLAAVIVGFLWSSYQNLSQFAGNSISRIRDYLRSPRQTGKKGKLFVDFLKSVGSLILLVLFLISCILIPICLWLTYSRGGLLSALIIASTMIIARMRGRRVPKEAVACAAIGIIIYGLFLHGQNGFCEEIIHVKDVSFLSRLTDSYSIQQRFSYLKASWAMISSNPWLGVGWGAFESAYPKFMTLGGFPVKLAHNNYAQVWAETGLIGINCFVGFWLVAMYTFWHKSRFMVSGKMRGIACGLGAALVGFLANSMVDFALYLPALAMLVYALAGLLASIPTADEEKDKFTIPFKTPLATALIVILCAFIFFLMKSYLASDINSKVEEERARAFPTEYSISRGVRPDPALQHAVLRASVGQLKKSISLFPLSADTYQMLGTAYLKLAEMEGAPQLLSEAIKSLKRAAELCPVSPYIQHSLAIAYWKQGTVSHQPADFQNALLAELRAANNFPVNPQYHKQLAEIYSALGDSKEAEREVAQTKELEKHYREF